MNIPAVLLGSALLIGACAPPLVPPPSPPRLDSSRLAVLPAEVRLTGTSAGPGRAAEITTRLNGLVISRLAARGYRVSAAGAATSGVDGAAWARHWNGRLDGLVGPPAADGRRGWESATFGDGAAGVARALGADVLVFARLDAHEKSDARITGELATAFAFGAIGALAVSSPPRSATLRMAMVEGPTGRMLWADEINTGGDLETVGLEGLVDGILLRFPNAPKSLAKEIR